MNVINRCILSSCLIIGGLFVATVPAYSEQPCHLTADQIQDIRFHYDLDRYMVGGCLVGATFSAITGLLTLSGITVVAAVPYIATGCSLGFLVGATSMTLYNLFSADGDVPKSLWQDVWNKPN